MMELAFLIVYCVLFSEQWCHIECLAYHCLLPLADWELCMWIIRSAYYMYHETGEPTPIKFEWPTEELVMEPNDKQYPRGGELFSKFWDKLWVQGTLFHIISLNCKNTKIFEIPLALHLKIHMECFDFLSLWHCSDVHTS